MALRLSFKDGDPADRLDALLRARQGQSREIDETVRSILSQVREKGDEALIALTRQFDGFELTSETLAVSEEEIDQAFDSVDDKALAALTLARNRIEAHHRRQLPNDDAYTDPLGVEIGSHWGPIDAVGIYVPGGTASYPSSVLMNAVPARLAGVERIAMVVPSPGGEINPLVLAAARLSGISSIHRIGGAQAIAALAFGTASIKAVDKIVGPGNAYVASAKRQVFGTVGIDMVAGPSEVLIIADGANDPAWIAADLLAQAEHDQAAQSILITDDADFADDVDKAVTAQLAVLARAETAAASWRDFGAIIVVKTMEDAPAIANRIAPEHLEMALEQPDDILRQIRHAGTIFLGRFTPEVIGDYVAGSNHVLPTGRSARFSSGLGVLDFMKRTTILRLGPEQLAALGPAAITLAEAEGLSAHARSVAIRLNSA